MPPMPPILPASCPDEGTWRAWLDGERPGDRPAPSSEPAQLDMHLGACATCRATVDGLRANAALAARALGAPVPVLADADVRLARQRLAARRAASIASTPTPPRERTPIPMLATLPRPWTSRTRTALGGLAAALLFTFLVGFTPQGQATASAFLAQFRGERLQVVPVDASQMQNVERVLAQLDRLGSVQRPAGLAGGGRPEELKTLAEASQKMGVAVKSPAYLPPGVKDTPRIGYLPGSEGRFTFAASKARAYFQSINRLDVQLPAQLDGATLVVRTPAAVMLTYPGPDSAALGLLVGQAGQLTMDVESTRGVTLEELRTFLLALPGMPPELAAQLRAIQDWRTTLPLPVPVDQVTWKQERASSGVERLIVDDRSGLGSGALWQQDGRIYGVGGGYKSDEIRRVADSLR